MSSPYQSQRVETEKPDGVLQCNLTPVVELLEGSHAVFDMDDSARKA